MSGWKACSAVLFLGIAWLLQPRAEPDDEQTKALARASKARIEAARKTYEVLWADYREGLRVGHDTLYRWSLRWLDAEKQSGKKEADQAAALQAHRDRMAALEQLIRKVRRIGQATVDELSAAEYYRVEAEFWVLQAGANKKGT
jgi:hypothetical protein